MLSHKMSREASTDAGTWQGVSNSRSENARKANKKNKLLS